MWIYSWTNMSVIDTEWNKVIGKKLLEKIRTISDLYFATLLLLILIKMYETLGYM